MPCRVAPVPLLWAVQTPLPALLERMAPPSPTARHSPPVVQATPCRFALVPLLCRLQLAPPLVVPTMVPPSPTARQEAGGATALRAPGRPSVCGGADGAVAAHGIAHRGAGARQAVEILNGAAAL